MNIVFVITRSDTIGGAHIHVRDLARYLIRNRHAVTVLAGGQGPFTDLLAQDGIPYVSIVGLQRRISARNDVSAVLELRKVIWEISPDLISAHSAKAGLLARIAGKCTRTPVIYTAHGWPFTEGTSRYARWIFRMVERLAAPLTTVIVTVSLYDKRLSENVGISKNTQVVAIQNGVHDVEPQHRLTRKSDVFKIAMVARLDKQKDHGTLLLALHEIRDWSWTLDLIGDGPLEAEIRNLSEKLGIDGRICFRGLRTDVHEFLANASVFILATHWEGLPRSILEAMRAGLPVIATDVGGISEAVVHGETGLIVQPGDSAALAESILALLNSRDLRSCMGRAGRIRYEDMFTFDRMARETVNVYQDVLRNT